MNALRFEILPGVAPVRGHPRYVKEDYAFGFQMEGGGKESRKGTQGTTSFVMDTLQLEVAVDSSLCLYIWGYCPTGRCKRSPLSPPMAQPGSLRAIHDAPLIPGVSVGLEEMIPATAWFDPTSGWLCMGNNEAPAVAQAVECARGCLAIVLADGWLSSLWVKPENWQEVAGQCSKS
jgi:hypothetical protein